MSMINKIVCTDAVVTTKAFEECRVKEGRRRKRSRGREFLKQEPHLRAAGLPGAELAG